MRVTTSRRALWAWLREIQGEVGPTVIPQVPQAARDSFKALDVADVLFDPAPPRFVRAACQNDPGEIRNGSADVLGPPGVLVIDHVERRKEQLVVVARAAVGEFCQLPGVYFKSGARLTAHRLMRSHVSAPAVSRLGSLKSQRASFRPGVRMALAATMMDRLMSAELAASVVR